MKSHPILEDANSLFPEANLSHLNYCSTVDMKSLQSEFNMFIHVLILNTPVYTLMKV